jgi:hypothetical protein
MIWNEHKRMQSYLKGILYCSIWNGTFRVPHYSHSQQQDTAEDLPPPSESLNHGTTETHLLFVDYVKAFVSVSRKKNMGNNG